MLSCVPKRSLLIKSFANRRPSAARPGVAGDGNSDRKVYNVSSIALHAAEQHANAQSGADHLHGGARNNNGNTIGTSRADRRDGSNLCAAIRRAVATPSHQNNSTKRGGDRVKASRA